MNTEIQLAKDYLAVLANGGKTGADHIHNLEILKEKFLDKQISVTANNEFLFEGIDHFNEHAMQFINQVGSYEVKVWELFAAENNTVVARYTFITDTIGNIPCITLFRFVNNKIKEINEVFYLSAPIEYKLEEPTA